MDKCQKRAGRQKKPARFHVIPQGGIRPEIHSCLRNRFPMNAVFRAVFMSSAPELLFFIAEPVDQVRIDFHFLRQSLPFSFSSVFRPADFPAGDFCVFLRCSRKIMELFNNFFVETHGYYSIITLYLYNIRVNR